MKTCPLPMVSEESVMLIELFTHYQNGHLPRAGGVLDQPAVLLEAFNIVGGILAENAARERRERHAAWTA